MARRRRYGDETWRLALARDAAALHAAADLLLRDDAAPPDYEGHRARGFAFAVEGRGDEALRELEQGRTQDWPFAAAYAADTARVSYLCGDYERCLAALRLALEGHERVDPSVAELVAAVARRAPSLRRDALKVALAGGTPWQRLRNAAAVAVAR